MTAHCAASKTVASQNEVTKVQIANSIRAEVESGQQRVGLRQAIKRKGALMMARRRWQQGSISRQLPQRSAVVVRQVFGDRKTLTGEGRHPRVYLGTVASMTKRMALRALQPYIDKGNNVVGAPAKVVCGKGSITFADFADKWLAQVLRDKEVSTRDVWGGALRYRLLPRWGKYAIADIDPESVKVWFNQLKDGGTGLPTLITVRNALASIMKVAVKWGYIQSSPCAGLELGKPKPKVKTIPDVNDYQKALAISGDDAVLLRTLAETGIRAGELMALRIERVSQFLDIDFNHGAMHIQRRLYHNDVDTPKTNAGTRRIALSKSLLAILKEHIGERTSGPVFMSNQERAFSICTLQRKVRDVFSKIGLEDVTPHYLRHFNATLMDSLNIPASVQRSRLGHAGETLTHHYTHTFSKD